MLDPQSCGQATKFVFETTPTDYGETGIWLEIEEGRHRRDHSLMSLQPVEPTDTADQGRSGDLR